MKCRRKSIANAFAKGICPVFDKAGPWRTCDALPATPVSVAPSSPMPPRAAASGGIAFGGHLAMFAFGGRGLLATASVTKLLRGAKVADVPVEQPSTRSSRRPVLAASEGQSVGAQVLIHYRPRPARSASQNSRHRSSCATFWTHILRGVRTHLFPGLVRIEPVHALHALHRVVAEILLVDRAGMIDEEGHHA